MKDAYRLYRRVCWVFAIAFAVVFAGLLTIPGFLARMLTGAAGLFGLGGEIAIGAGDLDHVLSLSLMGCITVLAWFSAKRPERLEPYVALLTAKAISTLSFVYLALIEGGAWVLPAVTDGTVIVGLVFARSLAAPEPVPQRRISGGEGESEDSEAESDSSEA